jgi:hypothetical protein
VRKQIAFRNRLNKIECAEARGIGFQNRVMIPINDDRSQGGMRDLAFNYKVQPIEGTQANLGDHQVR